MPKRLTSAQQAAYHRDGYVAPIDIFDADEVAAIRSALEAAEADHGELMQGPGPQQRALRPSGTGLDCA